MATLPMKAKQRAETIILEKSAKTNEEGDSVEVRGGFSK